MCDGHDSTIAKRDGGLKMGETYYFYVRHHVPLVDLAASLADTVAVRAGWRHRNA